MGRVTDPFANLRKAGELEYTPQKNAWAHRHNIQYFISHGSQTSYFPDLRNHAIYAGPNGVL